MFRGEFSIYLENFQENILVVDEDQEIQELTVKLIDFGFGSRILEGVKLRAKVGTFVRLGEWTKIDLMIL